MASPNRTTVTTAELASRAQVERLEAQKKAALSLLTEAVQSTCPARFSEPGRPAQFRDCNKCWTCRAQGFLADVRALDAREVA